VYSKNLGTKVNVDLYSALS